MSEFYRTADGLPGIGLGEWREGELNNVGMSERDLRLAEQVRGSRSAGVDVRPSTDGVTIKTTGAVGLIRFSGFEVRIDPKLPGDHLNLFRMVEFASGLDGLGQLAGSPGLHSSGTHLLDFIVEMLCLETQRLLVTGLRADYVEREEDLRALRGRLLADRQHLERFGLFDRVVCRYDEHEHDIPDNQLLAFGLRRAGRVATLPRLRRRARTLAAMLDEVCDPAALNLRLGAAQFSYTRHNEQYRVAHALSWLLIEQRALKEGLETGPLQLRSFLIDMNTLFERFLERILQVVFADEKILVHAQRSNSIFWRPDLNRRYASVRPDLLLERVERRQARLPIDAKYKRYEERNVDAGDLTQVFLYAYAYRDPKGLNAPRSVIIHPSERLGGEPGVTHLQVRSVAERLVDAELAVVAVHIPTLLDEVEDGSGPALDGLREVLALAVPVNASGPPEAQALTA